MSYHIKFISVFVQSYISWDGFLICLDNLVIFWKGEHLKYLHWQTQTEIVLICVYAQKGFCRLDFTLMIHQHLNSSMQSNYLMLLSVAPPPHRWPCVMTFYFGVRFRAELQMFGCKHIYKITNDTHDIRCKMSVSDMVDHKSL